MGVGAALIGVALGGAGCKPDPCEEAAAHEPALWLGHGPDGFTEITDGQELHLEYGFQGGQHIWVALRARGILPGREGFFNDRDAPLVRLTLTRLSDDQHWAELREDWQAFQGDAAQSERLGLQLAMALYPEEELESAFRLDAEVQDVCGTVVQDSAEVELALPDYF